MVGLWFLGSTGRNTGPEPKVSFYSLPASCRIPSERKPKPQPRRPIRRGGRAAATSFEPPARVAAGRHAQRTRPAPANRRATNREILTPITHKFCYTTPFLFHRVSSRCPVGLAS